MSLRKAGFVRAQNHRQMPKLRDWKPKRLENRNLTRRVGKVIVSPHHVGNVHQRVINNH